MKKVSRERVGKELVGMLVGSAAHPERALRLIHELRLCSSIFLPPAGQQIFNSDGTAVSAEAASDSVWDLGYAYAARMYDLVLAQKEISAGVTSTKADDASKASEEEQNALKLRILAAFLLPFADQYVIEKKRQVLLPTFVIRESLKVRLCASNSVFHCECSLTTDLLIFCLVPVAFNHYFSYATVTPKTWET